MSLTAQQPNGRAAALKVDADGNLLTAGSGTAPLPSGAATSALQTAGNASLTSLDADLGAQADAAATTDTGTFSVVALVKRGLQNWTTLLARIPALSGGRVPVTDADLRPVSRVVTASYIRPADTVTYAAGDVIAQSTTVATVLTFANCAKANGLGGILQGAIMIDSSAPTLKLDAELYLFDTAPVMQQDNVAWAPSDTEMEACIGMIAFATGSFKSANPSNNGINSVEGLAKVFQCAAGTTSLFGVLVARNAYIPTNPEKLTIRLQIIQD